MSYGLIRRQKNLLAGLISALLMLAILIGPAAKASAADYTLNLVAGQTLYPGDALWSPNHLYRLLMQSDGNLVLYSMPGNKPFWATGTTRYPGSVLQMQGDGNLVVYAPGHVAVWASNTANHPGTVLQMQNDANAVLYAPGHVAIWATNAQYIAGCQDGNRTQAAQYATTGNWYNPVPVVAWDDRIGPTEDSAGTVELRYYPSARCGWALVTGGAVNEVWIDRSSDGGLTWVGHLGDRSIHIGNSSTYTGVYNDSYPYVMRACAVGVGPVHCTGWY